MHDRSLDRSQVVGTWRLRTWDSVFEDGSVGYVMGDTPVVGVIVYTADGTMITTISAADRPPIDGDDPLSGPDDQRLQAMATFIAYSGTYRLEGSDVIHDVAISLHPNWVGGSQRRHATLSEDGQTLTLSTDRMLVGGRPSIQRLIWERVRD